MMNVRIFAYGSNLSTARIRARVASAQPVAVGYVPRRQLVFHKRSMDGSAKADAYWTGSDDHRLWGVVYEIHKDDKPILDECEFLGLGYDEREVDVIHANGLLKSWSYIARQEAIDRTLLPYHWYHQFVLQGAREHGLPEEYINTLESHSTWDDPDAKRAEENRLLIISESHVFKRDDSNR